MRRYFDLAVIVPLEEEFLRVVEAFEFVEDLSSKSHIRFAAKSADGEFSLLLVRQYSMGKTEAHNATTNILFDFEIGLLVCLGIAGALSDDLRPGDICYSKTVIDLLDNAKVTEERDDPKIELAFSPTYFETPAELTVAISLDRTNPQRATSLRQWQQDLEVAAKLLLPAPFTGRKGKKESIAAPSIFEGSIICAAVSGSPTYNRKVKGVERKALVIETEAGGVFSAAKLRDVPAIAIRGVSDFADLNKNILEEETDNKARVLAATNATAFLVRQLENPRFRNFLERARQRDESGSLPQAGPDQVVDPVMKALVEQEEDIERKLRDLAPGYSLQTKGYRLPVPRVRLVSTSQIGTDPLPNPEIEVREAIRSNRVLTLRVPQQYPDLSLSWVLANDLLSSITDGKQAIPATIVGDALQVPRTGVRQLVSRNVNELIDREDVRVVIIIDNFKFDSKTKVAFLVQEVESLKNCHFIVVTKSRRNIVAESDFVNLTNSSVADVCDVSFLETTHFLQKNFEMNGPASQVVATRLRETFQTFDLPTHPTYFAGIPRTVLNDLLQANRRAELIDLAVAGYLSFIVAEDEEPVALSRTTREAFLSELAFETCVQLKCFSEEQLINFTAEYAKRYDYNITPVMFVSSFLKRSILHFDGGCVRFTLPFMESLLIAKYLRNDTQSALGYFTASRTGVDQRTFALYSELGAAPEVVERLQQKLDDSIQALEARALSPHILLTQEVNPNFLTRDGHLKSFQKKLSETAADVQLDRDVSLDKQRLLDAADKVRHSAFKRREAALGDTEEERSERMSVEENAMSSWITSVNLLGSGSERLLAPVKRVLINKIVRLSALIIGDWTREQSAVDFETLKTELQSDKDFVGNLIATGSKEDEKQARLIVSDIIDIIEYQLVSQPLIWSISVLCEEARDKVLAESIIYCSFTDPMDTLIRDVWLSDIDVQSGKAPLEKAVKTLPNVGLLRLNLASHLVGRAYWKHWRKEDKLVLIDIANACISPLGRHFDKGRIKRELGVKTQPKQPRRRGKR